MSGSRSLVELASLINDVGCAPSLAWSDLSRHNALDETVMGRSRHDAPTARSNRETMFLDVPVMRALARVELPSDICLTTQVIDACLQA